MVHIPSVTWSLPSLFSHQWRESFKHETLSLDFLYLRLLVYPMVRYATETPFVFFHRRRLCVSIPVHVRNRLPLILPKSRGAQGNRTTRTRLVLNVWVHRRNLHYVRYWFNILVHLTHPHRDTHSPYLPSPSKQNQSLPLSSDLYHSTNLSWVPSPT